MLNVTIQWSDPFQYEDSDGTKKWRRIWLIPVEYRPAFFDFWRGNKYKLWDEGFSVQKIENDWFLIETKISCALFKEFKGQPKPAPAPEEQFWLPPYEVKDTTGLRTWQVDSVSKLVAAINHWGSAIDGSDTGVGKTYVACAVARELGMKILVVCPKSVMESWRRVVERHFKMKDQLEGIINYEQIRIGKKDNPFASYITNRKTHRDKLTWKISKDTLIIWDESQKLKNWKTKNSKTCVAAMKQGYRMMFCSATNATNPLELRTVGTALQLFKGSKQYYNWCYEHGVERGRWGMVFTENMTLRKKVLKKLHQDIFINRGCRLTRDTIPNFPESEIIADCYNMEDNDVKNINQIHDEMKKELNKLSNLVKRDSSSELTAILRARQKIELIKVPLFIDMIEEGLENGMSVVVFLNFTETLHAISKRLNTTCIFDGKTADKIRNQNVDDFQDDKQRVILVNLQSGGSGLSLHDLHGNFPRISLISPSYSAVLMRQSTGRIWRDDGKSKSVQKIVFVAGTVEEQVCQNVQEKLKNLDILNDGDMQYEEIYKVN